MPKDVKKILTPIDFSDYADRALAWALSLADRYQAEVTLLYVEPDLTKMWGAHLLGGKEPAKELTQFWAENEMRLQHKATDLQQQGKRVTALIRHGYPFDEICKAADEHGIDLIVMGTRGITGLSHVTMGSVAERVVRHAPCPVLTVR